MLLSQSDTPTMNQTVIVKEYIEGRDISLLLIPEVQRSTFYSSTAHYLQ